MSDHRAFFDAIVAQMQRPPVETMGLEELRAEVLMLREHMRTLYGVWMDAEDDAIVAHREGAAWMQGACVEWANTWIETGGNDDTESLVAGLEAIPLPDAADEGGSHD